MTDVIYSYSLEQAIEDGILMKPFDDEMSKQVDNKPIVATTHLFNDFGNEKLLILWDNFLAWRKGVMPTLPEEDRMFSIMFYGKKVWVDETESQVTLMYPEDY